MPGEGDMSSPGARLQRRGTCRVCGHRIREEGGGGHVEQSDTGSKKGPGNTFLVLELVIGASGPL